MIFSIRTRFWLMLTLTVIMGYFTYISFMNRSFLWGILMLIFTLFNYEATRSLYKSVGGFRGASRIARKQEAFHENTNLNDLD